MTNPETLQWVAKELTPRLSGVTAKARVISGIPTLTIGHLQKTGVGCSWFRLVPLLPNLILHLPPNNNDGYYLTRPESLEATANIIHLEYLRWSQG